MGSLLLLIVVLSAVLGVDAQSTALASDSSYTSTTTAASTFLVTVTASTDPPRETQNFEIPECIVTCFSGSGFYRSCGMNQFKCLCTNERDSLDGYIESVSYCLTNKPTCRGENVTAFMDTFQEECAKVGNPITTYPTAIATWFHAVSVVTLTSASSSSSDSWTPLEPSASVTSSSSLSSTNPSRTTPTSTTSTPTNDVSTPFGEENAAGEGAGISGPEKIAIGVGVAAGILFILLLGALAYFLIRRRKKHKPVHKFESNASPYTDEAGGVVELDGFGIPSELPGSDMSEYRNDGRSEMLNSSRTGASDNDAMVRERYTAGKHAADVYELDAPPGMPLQMSTRGRGAGE